MLVFGKEVAVKVSKQIKLYDLQQFCLALNLNYENCFYEITSNPILTVVELGDRMYIDAKSIAQWLIVPGIGKVSSHAAIHFAALLSEKLINNQNELIEQLIDKCGME